MTTRRVSLLDSPLRDVPFQLLPGATYPATMLESLLRWQEQFANSTDELPSFTVCVVGDAASARRSLESLTVQSYRNFNVVGMSGSNPFQTLKESSCGDYVVFLPSGALLHPTALFTFAKQLQVGDISYLYTNDISLNSELSAAIHYRRRSPLDRYSLLGSNTTGALICLSRKAAFGIADDELIAIISADAVTDRWDAITFTSLLNWRVASWISSTHPAESKLLPLALLALPEGGFGVSVEEAARAIIEQHGKDNGIQIESVEPLPQSSEGVFEFQPYPLLRRAKIQVVVPFRGAIDLTRQCVLSLVEQECRSDLTITLVDNGTSQTERDELEKMLREIPTPTEISIVEDDRYFNFARLCNIGSAAADTPFILFLNNDVELRDPNTITELLRWGVQREVGAVGGKLLYPSGDIQHGGMSFAAIRPKNISTSDEFASLFREVDGVTFAMALVRREVFNEVGGLDEKHCPNGFGDALFCHNLRELGYRIIYTPTASAIHHESLSRGRRPEELEFWEMHEAGIPIPELYDDFQSARRPAQIRLDRIQEPAVITLSRALHRYQRSIPLLNTVAGFIVRSLRRLKTKRGSAQIHSPETRPSVSATEPS